MSLAAPMVLRDGAADTDPWTAAALHLSALRTDRIGDGAGAIVTRTLEIVFVQAIRAIRAELRGDDEASDFFVALADRLLSRACAAIHAAPAAPWTLTQLVRKAGLNILVVRESYLPEIRGWRR